MLILIQINRFKCGNYLIKSISKENVITDLSQTWDVIVDTKHKHKHDLHQYFSNYRTPLICQQIIKLSISTFVLVLMIQRD